MITAVTTGACLILMAFNTVNCLPFVNQCPNMDSMPDLNVQKFQGSWYEVMRTPFNGPLTTRCNSETYTVVNSNVNINAQFIDIASSINLRSFGTAVVDAKTPSVWKFSFPEVEATGDLKILATDYDNYAVLYRCRMIEHFQIETGWVLSRQRVLREDIKNNILAKYKEIGGNPDELLYVDNGNC